MTTLKKEDIDMLGKIAEIIKNSDFDLRDVRFVEQKDYGTDTYKSKLEFELVRK
jgi:hypothetical protein